MTEPSKEDIATAAGLPAGLGSRLQGETEAALAEDARKLAAALGTSKPAPRTMDELIRAAGRPAPAAPPAGEEPPPVTDFDGGPRAPGPPPPPSMDSQLRAAVSERRSQIASHAADLDHERRND